jgi:hypothetical protein
MGSTGPHNHRAKLQICLFLIAGCGEGVLSQQRAAGVDRDAGGILREGDGSAALSSAGRLGRGDTGSSSRDPYRSGDLPANGVDRRSVRDASVRSDVAAADGAQAADLTERDAATRRPRRDAPLASPDAVARDAGTTAPPDTALPDLAESPVEETPPCTPGDWVLSKTIDLSSETVEDDQSSGAIFWNPPFVQLSASRSTQAHAIHFRPVAEGRWSGQAVTVDRELKLLARHDDVFEASFPLDNISSGSPLRLIRDSDKAFQAAYDPTQGRFGIAYADAPSGEQGIYFRTYDPNTGVVSTPRALIESERYPNDINLTYRAGANGSPSGFTLAHGNDCKHWNPSSAGHYCAYLTALDRAGKRLSPAFVFIQHYSYHVLGMELAASASRHFVGYLNDHGSLQSHDNQLGFSTIEMPGADTRVVVPANTLDPTSSGFSDRQIDMAQRGSRMLLVWNRVHKVDDLTRSKLIFRSFETSGAPLQRSEITGLDAWIDAPQIAATADGQLGIAWLERSDEMFPDNFIRLRFRGFEGSDPIAPQGGAVTVNLRKAFGYGDKTYVLQAGLDLVALEGRFIVLLGIHTQTNERGFPRQQDTFLLAFRRSCNR